MTRIAYVARLALSAAMLTALVLPAPAATFNVLYKFKHPSVGYPEARVDLMNGNLFGTGSGDISYGDGQVFELTNSNGTWSETSPLIFNGTDGRTPYGGLIHDTNGNIYGTTSAGGGYDGGNAFYIFYSGGSWTFEKMWDFGSYTGDGTNPSGDLIMDSSGNLYGTTQNGGTYGGGTVFEISPQGVFVETILHSFGHGRDGAHPYAGLMIDSAGNLYGTTVNGGTHTECTSGCGTAFELTQSGGNWKETVLHNFGSTFKDGRNPYGGLIQNPKTGVLYGMTSYGGATVCGSYNCGTVFKLYLSNGTWKEKVLYNFDGTNGAFPVAKLTWGGTTSTLYGMAASGGGGYGSLFELTFSGGAWHETTLGVFGSDAAYPLGALIRDSSGNLYGTTYEGGDFTSCQYGCGTVWEYTP